MEICKDEGEKVEETEKTSIADKDASGKKKKYKFRTARRWQSRKRKGFLKKRKEGLEEKGAGSGSSPCEVNEHVTAHKSKNNGCEGQQIDETVATIYKPIINRSAEKLKSSPFESLISTDGKVQTRSKSYRRSNAKGEPVMSKGFKIMDIELIAHCIKTAAICSICKRADSQLTLKEVPRNRRGMGEELFLECSICHQKTDLKTSKKIKVDKRKSIYESNIRSVYAAQKMGQRGLKKFCGVMNMPPPVTMKSYNNIKKIIHKKSKERAEEEMKNAANELLDLAIIEDPKDIRIMGDGAMTCNVPVTVDGTWQKRGHSSKIGVVFVLSVLTGKVLDYEMKSLYCHECVAHNNDDKCTEAYKIWWANHQPTCNINHKGSSDSMERQGAIDIFLRSKEKYGLRYTTFVGDGDSSTYGDVKQHCYDKYGADYCVTKEECVGHVQKRLGRALRDYKQKNKGKKLSDGKGIGGKGRLTDKICDKMQNHYGTAIRSHSNDPDGMYESIWAIFKHMIKCDSESLEEQHRYCPKIQSTWCKFWKDGAKYNEDKRLPSAFLEELRPIFVRLSEDKLLQRCLMGLTQNQNEAINGILWSNCPKTSFCGRQKVEIAVCETVCYFNSGAASKGIILKKIGLEPGENMLRAIESQDCERIKEAERKISLKYRVNRRKHRAEKKSKGEKEPIVYKAGGFGLSSEPDSPFEIVLDGNFEEKEKKTENKKRKSQSKILKDGHGMVKKAKRSISKGKVATATKKDGEISPPEEPEIKFVSDSEAQDII